MSHVLHNVYVFTRTFFQQFTIRKPPFKTLFPKRLEDEYNVYQPDNPWSFGFARENHCRTFIPNETIRVKKHGYHAKVKTRKGRKQIMRRLLKGRYIITH